MSRQYISAGRIVDEVLDGSRSFKSVAHSSDGISNKVEYLLAAQTLKYKATLFSLLETVLKNQGGGSNLESLFTETQKGIFLVMLYELLFSAHKSIHGGGRVKKMIMQKYAENLKALASSRNDNVSHEGIDQEQNTLDQLHHPIEPIVPQYIRINQVKTAIDEGFEYVRNKFPDEEKVSVVLDDLITGLVKISSQNSLPGHSPMKARLTGDDPFVRDGSLIIQDKASCFPSQLLFNCWKQANLPLSGLNLPSLHVLDACAAPGNKTTHLAALFSSLRTSYPNLTYRITAVEKDGTRSELLQRRVTQAGVKGQVRVVNEDFLQLDVKDGQYKDVSAVLLDPSCSGSGMHGRTSEHQSPAEQEQLLLRVEKLRRFQLQCLLKAMGFGQAELVVYSTCSVHLQENEAVVAEALHWQRNWAQGKAAAGGGWRLVEPVG